MRRLEIRCFVDRARAREGVVLFFSFSASSSFGKKIFRYRWHNLEFSFKMLDTALLFRKGVLLGGRERLLLKTKRTSFACSTLLLSPVDRGNPGNKGRKAFLKARLPIVTSVYSAELSQEDKESSGSCHSQDPPGGRLVPRTSETQGRWNLKRGAIQERNVRE